MSAVLNCNKGIGFGVVVLLSGSIVAVVGFFTEAVVVHVSTCSKGVVVAGCFKGEEKDVLMGVLRSSFVVEATSGVVGGSSIE